MERERILDYFKENTHSKAGATHIARTLLCDENECTRVLYELENEGYLVKTKKDAYTLPGTMSQARGTVLAHPDGFAFLRTEDGDVFIPRNALNGAMHNDIVLAKLAQGRRGIEGEVKRIITRANASVVGQYKKGKYGGYIAPDEKKIPLIEIPAGSEMRAHDGDKVLVEITGWPKGGIAAQAKVIEIFGRTGESAADILSIACSCGLRRKFPEAVLAEADAIPQTITIAELEKRRDLRQRTIVTMDGETAKDLDDAISIKKTKTGYELGVHIADVSHYVKDQMELDKEALLRGNSAYLLDVVLPMLPERLSNGICSLNPNIDRLTMTCDMSVDFDGKVTNYAIYESVIKSTARLTYEQVNRALDGDVEETEKLSHLMEDIGQYKELYEILNRKRMARGSVELDVAECEIELNKKGFPVKIFKRDRGTAERMIEEFMLLANETVAKHAENMQLPFMYRIHESPDPVKMAALMEFLSGLGLQLKKTRDGVHPLQLQELLQSVEGTKIGKLVSKVVLRSMQKAKYSEKPVGHYALALRDYSHFTSPIRRYPDLTIHRMLKLAIAGMMDEKRAGYWHDRMPGMAQQCSMTERQAQEAERAVDDLKKAQYMYAHIGEQFPGVISGVTEWGIYVELENTVEGFVHVTMLPQDDYIYEEKRHMLVGTHRGHKYRLGDDADIIVEGADVRSRKIDFALAGVKLTLNQRENNIKRNEKRRTPRN